MAGPIFEEAEAEWRKRRCAEHLAVCKAAWRAGAIGAFADAVEWCRLYQQPPPVWIERAARRLCAQSQTKAEAKRHRELMVHYARWDAVKDLRERRLELSKVRDDVEPDLSWERCWEVVSRLLAGTDAGGSDLTIKASYALVQKDIKEGRGARYYTPLPPL